MSLSKPNLGGRPKTSGVWEYFVHKIDANSSQCIVDVGSKSCSKTFSGRNSTNLKTHLGSVHKEAFDALNSKESAVKSERALKDSATHRAGKSSATPNSNSIKNFMVKQATYGHDIEQHRTRVRGLVRFIAESGVTTLLPSADAFKDFCKILDPNVTDVCSH